MDPTRVRTARGGLRVGLAWGPHPWGHPPRRVGKLLSMGALYRNLERALRSCATEVRPWRAEPEDSALGDHVAGVDVMFVDCYSHSFPFLEHRAEHGGRWQAVILAHGNMPKAGDPLLVQAPHLLRPNDGVLFTSQADLAIWRRLVDRHQLMEAVIPPAVDLEIFNPTPSGVDDAVRDRFGLPPTEPLLLFVGRHNIQKNLHGLLAVLREVRRSVPSVHLGVVGEPDDIWLAEFRVANTGYLDWLRGEAAALGLHDAIHFCGPAFGRDLAALYRTADVLVNLGFYHRENFGMAQAEAHACGTPVVCSAWGGFREVIQPDVTGVVVDAALTNHGIRVDWSGAADAVAALLADAPRRHAMGGAAARTVATRFSVDALADNLQRYLDILVRAESRPTPPGTPGPPGAALHPSTLALDYKRHAGDYGWLDPQSDINWERPMFGGSSYQIYEQLVGPYASTVASALEPAQVDTGWVPARVPGWELDQPRQLVVDHDPVWPHRRFIVDQGTWTLVNQIDDRRTLADLADAAGLAPSEATRIATELYRDGFITFRGVAPTGTKWY